MEKQVFINHPSNDVYSVIADIAGYLDIITWPRLKTVCIFCLYENQYILLDEINKLGACKITKNNSRSIHQREYINVEMSVSYDEIKTLLRIIVENDINAVMLCDCVKVILNDNDGDFIIVDAKNSKYNKIKALQQ